MFKRMIALLTVLLLPIFALADKTPKYQMFTFAGQLPDQLTEPLSAYVSDECHIVSGAAIQHNSNYVEPDEPMSRDSYTALMLVDTGDGLRLIAAAWVDGLPWQVSDFTRLLRRDENMSVSIYQPEPNRIPKFSVDYPAQSGLVSDLMQFRGNRLWQLSGHIDEASGTNISISLGTITLIDPQGRNDALCLKYFWLDYMTGIAELPTTRAEVLALESAAHAHLTSNEAQGFSYTAGANLRQEPTADSASLGLYNASVPLTLTGEQSQGTSFPWLQVHIGHTEGWMSGNYVYGLASQDYPVPMGRTVDGCAMYAALGDNQPAAQLAPGTTFHILTEIDGMYHICIPQGDISWEVDRDGTYGYISTKDVLTGCSPSALDALESAQ